MRARLLVGQNGTGRLVFSLWLARRKPDGPRESGSSAGAIMKLIRRRLSRPRASRMNLPNSISMSRIVMIPLLLWILSTHFPWRAHGEQEILASVLFILASMTDGLDGYLARRRSQVTTMGMLLDPFADKIMVTSALVALVAYNPQVVKVWIAVVIIGGRDENLIMAEVTKEWSNTVTKVCTESAGSENRVVGMIHPRAGLSNRYVFVEQGSSAPAYRFFVPWGLNHDGAITDVIDGELSVTTFDFDSNWKFAP